MVKRPYRSILPNTNNEQQKIFHMKNIIKSLGEKAFLQ